MEWTWPMPHKHGSHIIKAHSAQCGAHSNPFLTLNQPLAVISSSCDASSSNLDHRHPNLMASMTLATYVLGSVPETAEYTIIIPISYFRGPPAKRRFLRESPKLKDAKMTDDSSDSCLLPSCQSSWTVRNYQATRLLAPLPSCWCVGT